MAKQLWHCQPDQYHYAGFCAPWGLDKQPEMYLPCEGLTLSAAAGTSLIHLCTDRDEKCFTGLLVYGKRTTTKVSYLG